MTRATLLLALALMTACGGDDPAADPVAPPAGPGRNLPGYSVLLSQPYIELRQGAEGGVTAYASRWGGYTGIVSLSPRGAPVEVTALGSVVPAGRDSTRLRVVVGAGADTGRSRIVYITSGMTLGIDSVALELRVLPALPRQ